MSKFPGGHRGRVTPVPIPNTEVKPATADGTACVGVWESRSLPGVINKMPAAFSNMQRAFSFVRLRSAKHSRLRTAVYESRTCTREEMASLLALGHFAGFAPSAGLVVVRGTMFRLGPSG